jgi:hypothetical protein
MILLLPTLGVIPCTTDSYIVYESRLWKLNQINMALQTDRLWRMNQTNMALQEDRLRRMIQTNNALQAAVVEVLLVVAAVELTEEGMVAAVALVEVDMIWLWRLNQTTMAHLAAVVEVLVVVAAVELIEEEMVAAAALAEVDLAEVDLIQ